MFQFGMGNTITMYPFVLHSLSMSVFSSVIGPFGGFFASGFKRAFKIKVCFIAHHVPNSVWVRDFIVILNTIPELHKHEETCDGTSTEIYWVFTI